MKYVSKPHTARLGARGQLVIPAAIRKALDLHPGENLVVRLRADGVVELVRAREVVQSNQGLLGRLYPGLGGKALVEELIQDRRKEALRE